MLPDVKPQLVGKRYELLAPVGHGGMGTVFRALDRLTGQEVALKSVITPKQELPTSATHNESDFRLALAQEFKVLASLRHPYIIQVLDYGFDEDQMPFFTMELLEDAQTILEAGLGRSLMPKINFIVQMLRALAYLHRRKILHRDVKPANILVVDGQIKVLDFGLSVMRDRSGQTSDSLDNDITAGTLSYMAPEVLVGNKPTQLADLYGAGMIAYELLAERHPFTYRNAAELINHVLYTQPDISAIADTLDIALVVQKMLQKDPHDRYAHAGDIINALNDASPGSIPAETLETRESFLKGAKLVGRRRELRQLRDAMRVANAGQGSAWLVGGESGVGKSRFVEELRTLAMVNGTLVMRGQAVSEGGSPYQLWRQVLSWVALLRDLDPLDAGLVKLIVPDIVTLSPYDLAAAGNLNAQEVQSRLLQMITETIRDQSHTVVITLEDLHWASSESLSLLAELSEAFSELRVLLVATYRDDERPGLPADLPQIPSLKLGRLNDEEIAELSEAILGEAGQQKAVVNLLQRETEGNVFFLTEVVRALAHEAGQLEQIGLMTLPEYVFAGGVETVIQRRLDALPATAYHYLETAAVIGRHVDLNILKTIEPDLDIDLWLVDCVNAAVLEILDGKWRFVHDKIRDGIIKRISEENRQLLHAKIAETIESHYGEKDRAAALAYHWGIAADLAKEGYYVTLAGEQALRNGAFREAVTYYERALHLLDQAQLNDMTSVRRRISLQHSQASAYLGFGQYAQAQALYKSNFLLSKPIDDQAEMASALHAMGDVAYAVNNLAHARQCYRKSFALYRNLADRASVSRVLNKLGNVAYDMGDDEQAKMLYHQSMMLARQAGTQWGMAGSALNTIEAAIVNNAEQDVSEKRLTQTLQIYVDEDNQEGVARSHYDLGVVAYERKDYETAYENFSNALMAYRHVDDLSGVIRTLTRLSEVLLELQKVETARQHLQQALKAAATFEAHILATEVLFAYAQLELSQHNHAMAFEVVAFCVNVDDLPESLLDDAERVLFDAETKLPPELIEVLWDRGKAHTFESVTQILYTQ